MMVLDCVVAADDEAALMEMVSSLRDEAFLGRVKRLATAHRLSTGEFLVLAVERFFQHARDEDWASLIAAIDNSADHSGTCLKKMVEFWARISVRECAD